MNCRIIIILVFATLISALICNVSAADSQSQMQISVSYSYSDIGYGRCSIEGKSSYFNVYVVNNGPTRTFQVVATSSYGVVSTSSNNGTLYPGQKLTVVFRTSSHPIEGDTDGEININIYDNTGGCFTFSAPWCILEESNIPKPDPRIIDATINCTVENEIEILTIRIYNAGDAGTVYLDVESDDGEISGYTSSPNTYIIPPISFDMEADEIYNAYFFAEPHSIYSDKTGEIEASVYLEHPWVTSLPPADEANFSWCILNYIAPITTVVETTTAAASSGFGFVVVIIAFLVGNKIKK